jgi:hypothetical protein
MVIRPEVLVDPFEPDLITAADALGVDRQQDFDADRDGVPVYGGSYGET